jgi:hypothetical protein
MLLLLLFINDLHDALGRLMITKIYLAINSSKLLIITAPFFEREIMGSVLSPEGVSFEVLVSLSLIFQVNVLYGNFGAVRIQLEK